VRTSRADAARDSSERTSPARTTTVLVTGATGYVGGRLVPELLARGHRVRCLVRDRGRLQGRRWSDAVEIVTGDLLQPETVAGSMDGVDAAYYLVHSMAGGAGFHERDMVAARAFGRAAAAAGVGRIVYLGGLGDPASDLSDHLRSRQQTGEALREAGVPVTEFRAAVVVGAGSISFEMIRHLTERLPAMVCPQWVYTKVQPIAVGDLLRYLVAALDVPESAGRVVEIGGADVQTYGGMMMGYAEARSLRRWLVPVPVLTPRLSSYWVHLVTPVPAPIARPLIEGLRSETVVRTTDARELFPDIVPVDYMTAVRAALGTLASRAVETAWSDALVTTCGDAPPSPLGERAGMLRERREAPVAATPATVFAVVSGLGGSRGYPVCDWAWQVRGAFDRLVGGVGLRRGRRDPDEVRVGDALDFWRVEAVDAGRLLRLRAEMKVPGEAWLEFEIRPVDAGRTLLVQTAYFAPKGLGGLLYWYGLYPVHARIFSGMIHALAGEAGAREGARARH
jgi:uncharacterized protein YbjT (DUF2867 family)